MACLDEIAHNKCWIDSEQLRKNFLSVEKNMRTSEEYITSTKEKIVSLNNGHTCLVYP